MTLPFVVEVDSKGFGLCVALGSEGGKEVKVGPRGSCRRLCPAMLFRFSHFCFVPH